MKPRGSQPPWLRYLYGHGRSQKPRTSSRSFPSITVVCSPNCQRHSSLIPVLRVTARAFERPEHDALVSPSGTTARTYNKGWRASVATSQPTHSLRPPFRGPTSATPLHSFSSDTPFTTQKMRSGHLSVLLPFIFVAQVAAHGYVKTVSIDGTSYAGNVPYRAPTSKSPPAQRMPDLISC